MADTSHDTKLEALQGAPLFAGLSRKELSHIAQVTEDLDVPEGKALCREGDTGQEFFLIVEGEAEVTQNGNHVATRRAGDFVGEIALVEETKRTATVTATTPLRVLALARQDFRSVIAENPEVERKVLRALAHRLVELAADPTVA